MNEEINTMGKAVGKVLDIDGPRLMCTRKFPSGKIGTFQAYQGMPIHLNEHLKTDKNTSATLRFYIGGEAGFGPETEVVVCGLRDVEVVGSQLDILIGTSKKMWSKIDKNSTQLQIKLSGAMGIEG